MINLFSTKLCALYSIAYISIAYCHYSSRCENYGYTSIALGVVVIFLIIDWSFRGGSTESGSKKAIDFYSAKGFSLKVNAIIQGHLIVRKIEEKALSKKYYLYWCLKTYFKAIVFFWLFYVFLFDFTNLELNEEHSFFYRFEPVRVISLFYYSIVTITTLGYGDIYSIGLVGKIVTALQSLIGVLMIGLFLWGLSYEHAEKTRINEQLKSLKDEEKAMRNIQHIVSRIIKGLNQHVGSAWNINLEDALAPGASHTTLKNDIYIKPDGVRGFLLNSNSWRNMVVSVDSYSVWDDDVDRLCWFSIVEDLVFFYTVHNEFVINGKYDFVDNHAEKYNFFGKDKGEAKKILMEETKGDQEQNIDLYIKTYYEINFYFVNSFNALSALFSSLGPKIEERKNKIESLKKALLA